MSFASVNFAIWIGFNQTPVPKSTWTKKKKNWREEDSDRSSSRLPTVGILNNLRAKFLLKTPLRGLQRHLLNYVVEITFLPDLASILAWSFAVSQSNSSLKKHRSRSIFSPFFCCFRNYNDYRVEPPPPNNKTLSLPPPPQENGSPPKVKPPIFPQTLRIPQTLLLHSEKQIWKKLERKYSWKRLVRV